MGAFVASSWRPHTDTWWFNETTDKLDAIIVETTGLADPAPVAQHFCGPGRGGSY